MITINYEAGSSLPKFPLCSNRLARLWRACPGLYLFIQIISCLRMIYTIAG